MFWHDRIIELVNQIVNREKNLTETSLADLGYIKIYIDVLKKETK